ncbi:MAG: hypothetical protein IJL06_03125 [Kiritimatiellae bacterium]|nr:hypothetical protein [Kiritimatiellia bacterium]
MVGHLREPAPDPLARLGVEALGGHRDAAGNGGGLRSRHAARVARDVVHAAAEAVGEVEPVGAAEALAADLVVALELRVDGRRAAGGGAAGGRELYENNIGIWLAPAMNIHRNPLCGRNFEYYAEDPLVAGKSAAAAIRGVQSSHAAVSLKHFACNNKEANRFASDSRLSERALREIYLRGFEIAVKEGDPITIMSSYNLINGQHTSESWELLTGILRTEWGFRGMVATDWGVKNDPVTEVLAGNDLKMPVGYPADLKKGLEDGRLTRADLEVCVRRILEMTLRMA